MVSKRRKQSTLPSVPKDEPPGAYNLSWPSSVSYTNIQRDRTESAGDADNQAEEAVQDGSPDSQLEHTSTPIYRRELGPSEFRLLCLTAREEHDSPMHFELETHPDDCHPEYETVSYT